jgi:hypothetical protein
MQAARRRDWAIRLEAVAAKERQAQDVCLKQGRAIRRHGFGKLDQADVMYNILY